MGPKHKSAICDRTPHLHIKPSLYVCRRVQGGTNLQVELNYLNLFKTYCIFSDLAFLASGGWGSWGGIWGDHLQSIWIQECSEVKNLQTESNYLDKLRTYGILVFWAPLWLLGMGQMGGGYLRIWEGVPTHVHMHMYRNCKWPPSWRHPFLSCLTWMCMHVHVCMGCPHTLTPTPTPIHPPYPYTPTSTPSTPTLPIYTHLYPIHTSPRGDPQNQ